MKKMIIGGLAAGAVALGIAAAVPAPAHADEPGVCGQSGVSAARARRKPQPDRRGAAPG